MMHDGHGWMWGIGWFWWIVLLIIIAALIWIISRALITNRKRPPKDRSARSILEQRYARGEISREDYQQMKKDIEG